MANSKLLKDAYEHLEQHYKSLIGIDFPPQVFDCTSCDGEYMEEVYRNKRYVVLYTETYDYYEVLDIKKYGEHPYEF